MLDGQNHLERHVFAALLAEHSSLLKRTREYSEQPAKNLIGLLDAFLVIAARTAAGDRLQAREDRDQFELILEEFNRAREALLLQQRDRADDFNLLEVMQLTHREIRHSMVLAWLLDRDLSKLGTHAQGNLGFSLFLEEVFLPANYALARYLVRREVAGDESIVDLEIGCRNEFLIHIENKIWSSEGVDQTDREWADLKRRAAEFGLDANKHAANVHALFLTPRGNRPTNENFRAIGWSRIARVLDRFAEQAKPPDVKLFAGHYARSLRRFIITRDLEQRDDNVEATPE